MFRVAEQIVVGPGLHVSAIAHLADVSSLSWSLKFGTHLGHIRAKRGSTER